MIIIVCNIEGEQCKEKLCEISILVWIENLPKKYSEHIEIIIWFIDDEIKNKVGPNILRFSLHNSLMYIRTKIKYPA
jgi:hypothetical protein